MKLSFQAHCSDCFNLTVYDDAGKEILEHNGYVEVVGDSDDVFLTIDVETGIIQDWDKMKAKLLELLKQNENSEK